jgi:hypothetical protein
VDSGETAVVEVILMYTRGAISQCFRRDAALRLCASAEVSAGATAASVVRPSSLGSVETVAEHDVDNVFIGSAPSGIVWGMQHVLTFSIFVGSDVMASSRAAWLILSVLVQLAAGDGLGGTNVRESRGFSAMGSF